MCALSEINQRKESAREAHSKPRAGGLQPLSRLATGGGGVAATTTQPQPHNKHDARLTSPLPVAREQQRRAWLCVREEGEVGGDEVQNKRTN